MPLISEPSTAESVAVVATAVAFATVLEAGQAYEVSSSTNCWIARAQALTFDDAVFIADNTTETITFGAAHGLTTGDGPFRVSNSGGGLPSGLVAATDYWAIVIDADTIKLATTLANALAGTAQLLATDGTGTHTMSDTSATIKVGGAAVALASGAMFVPAGVPRQIPGAFTVASTLRTKLSIIRDSADGKASLTRLAAV